MLIKAAYTNR